MATTLYLIRHAEAEGNLYRRCHGHYDSRVTDTGLAQIERLRDRLAGTPVDALYASDLRRTRATAQAVAIKDVQLNTTTELREIALGRWEDAPWGEVMQRDPDRYAAFSACSRAFSLEGAESFARVRARMLGAVERIVRRHEGQSVAVVSHGMALRMLLTALYGRDQEDCAGLSHLDNASLTTVVWDGNPQVISCGENDYLGELSTLRRQNWWRGDGAPADTNLWFARAETPADVAEAERLRREAWRTVYGTYDGYEATGLAGQIAGYLRHNPEHVKFVMRGGQRAGLLLLSDLGDARPREGHISLLYLDGPLRGSGYGVQLLGEAVSIFRAEGRDTLRLVVWEGNARAVRFYQKNGFAEVSREAGLFGPLLIMKKKFD